MCRLFAWHSDTSLTLNDVLGNDFDSFTNLSSIHQDGWGMAYQANKELKLVRDSNAANQSTAYKQAATDISSKNAIVHLRWATEELSVCIPNTHPFIKAGPTGPIAFCHNGGIARGDALRALIDDDLWAELDGDTDSEQYFAALITQLRKTNGNLVAAYQNLIAKVDSIKYTSLNALLMTDTDLFIICQHKPENRAVELEQDYYDLFWKTENGVTSAWSSGVRQNDHQTRSLINGTLLKINFSTGESEIYEIYQK